MSPHDKKSPCLGHLSCFNALSGDELEYINSQTKQLFFRKGETICKQGVYAPYVIFLADGLARIYLEVSRDKLISTHLAREGDFISFSAVFDQEEYNLSAMALTDASVCMINKDAVIALLKGNSEFGYRIISRNWQIEKRLLDIISNLSYKQMAGKLAITLIYLADFGYPGLFELLSRRELAAFANISVESTVKLLKEFESDSIISLEGKDIEIKNHRLLQEIAERG